MARYTDIDLLIDKIEGTDWYHISKQGELVLGANSKDDVPLYRHSDITDVLNNAPISDVDEAIKDGIRAFCAELVAEITADRDRAYDSITERNRRKESHLNDAFCIHEDGKLVALNGMLYSINELLKKYLEDKNERP